MQGIKNTWVCNLSAYQASHEKSSDDLRLNLWPWHFKKSADWKENA